MKVFKELGVVFAKAYVRVFQFARRFLNSYPTSLIYLRIRSIWKPDKKIEVQNIIRFAQCPVCGNEMIFSLGQIDYPDHLYFADTPIYLEHRAELGKCQNCESGFVQNITAEQHAAHFYEDKKSGRWTTDIPFEKRRTDLVVSTTGDLIAPGMHVLDVGCSDGIFLDFAATLGATTCGVEYSDASLAMAEAKGHKGYKSLDALDDGVSFDAVFCFDVIEHVYHVSSFLNHIAAFIRPGGFLVILTGDIQCINAQKFGPTWWYALYPEHVVFPSVKYFAELPDFELIKDLKTYAFKWQDGKPVWKFRNILLRWVIHDYHGMPSYTPDHYLVVLRKQS